MAILDSPYSMPTIFDPGNASSTFRTWGSEARSRAGGAAVFAKIGDSGAAPPRWSCV
jgi:hypothetical protein